jgi:hypothetical protein
MPAFLFTTPVKRLENVRRFVSQVYYYRYSGETSGETCSASSRRVAGLFLRCERRITLWRTGNGTDT